MSPLFNQHKWHKFQQKLHHIFWGKIYTVKCKLSYCNLCGQDYHSVWNHEERNIHQETSAYSLTNCSHSLSRSQLACRHSEVPSSYSSSHMLTMVCIAVMCYLVRTFWQPSVPWHIPAEQYSGSPSVWHSEVLVSTCTCFHVTVMATQQTTS